MSTAARSTPTGPTPAAAPPKRRRWLRRSLWTLGLLCLLLLLAPLALSLPPVRSMLASTIGEALDRRVEIDSAFAFWGKGIDLEDITVYSPDGYDGPIARIPKVHVDLDILSLLRGDLTAQVRVLQPHITLREDSQGASNVDGMLEHMTEPKEQESAERDAVVDLELAILGGRFEAPAAAGLPANVIDDIQLTASLEPNGRKRFDLRALARGAGKEGKDVPLKANADLDAEGAGDVTCLAPALDLERLAELVRRATGVRDLKGGLELDGKVTLKADETLEGSLRLEGDGISAVSAEGVRFSIRRLRGRIDLRSLQSATDANIQLRVGDLRVERGSGATAERFREPSLTLTAELRYNPASGLARIASARLDGGASISLTIPEPLKLETRPALRVQGKGQLRVDLGRLGRLSALLPALEPLGGGVLTASVEGSQAEGLDLGASITIANLRIRPTTWAPGGYGERRSVLTFRARQNETEGTRIRLHHLETGVLNASFAKERGLEITRDPEGRLGVAGSFQVRIDLPALSRLAGGLLGLEAGQQIAGAVLVGGTGHGSAEDMRVDATLRLQGVVVPAAWSEVRKPAHLSTQLRIETKRDRTQITLSDLQGMGLSGSGSARLDVGPEGRGFEQADATLGVDLRAARPWLGGLLGLAPRETLDGRLTSQLQILPEDDFKRLVATAQIDGLSWQRLPPARPIREPRISLRANLQMAPEGGRQLAEELLLDTGGLKLDLSGSSYVAEPDKDLDLALRLGGSADRLAPLLSAVLGEGYEDLRGQGSLAGQMTLRGSPSGNGSSLIADGRFSLGSWSTAGLDLGNVLVQAARAKLSDPLTASLDADVNGGKASATARATLGQRELPWTASLDIAGVDTSGMLVSKGPGRYLAFALPALLPSKTDLPVLSGRLDAKLEGGAPSIKSPAMEAGLVGKGTLHMAGGEIRQSTLFGGRGGSDMAKVISALKVAVPQAGQVLAEVTKAITFSSLDSRFRVAREVVTIENATLVGKRLDVHIKGTADFEQRVNLTTDVTLKGSAGQELGKVLPGGVIPMAVRGTMDDPKVRPNVDMTKLLAGGAAAKLPGLIDKLKGKKLPGGIPNPFK